QSRRLLTKPIMRHSSVSWIKSPAYRLRVHLSRTSPDYYLSKAVMFIYAQVNVRIRGREDAIVGASLVGARFAYPGVGDGPTGQAREPAPTNTLKWVVDQQGGHEDPPLR